MLRHICWELDIELINLNGLVVKELERVLDRFNCIPIEMSIIHLSSVKSEVPFDFRRELCKNIMMISRSLLITLSISFKHFYNLC